MKFLVVVMPPSIYHFIYNHDDHDRNIPTNILFLNIIFMLIEGVGHIWERFRVKIQIQEAKMTIWKWIKCREKYAKPFNTNMKINKINNRIRYLPRYHKG